jgi:lysophospholipase L1-like esterase
MKKIILFTISIVLFAATPAVAKPKVLWFVGDATAADHNSDSTLTSGWSTHFGNYIRPRISFVNLSGEGMSAKLFEDNGLQEKMEKLRKGSYVFLQFGTNDLNEKNIATYSSTDALALRFNKIIRTARQNRINIILVTPLAQPYYKDGQLIDRLGSYPDVVRHISIYHHLPLLDLQQVTYDWLNGMSEEEAAKYYTSTTLSQGEYQLTSEGAEIVAQMAKESIKNGKSKKLKKVLHR